MAPELEEASSARMTEPEPRPAKRASIPLTRAYLCEKIQGLAELHPEVRTFFYVDDITLLPNAVMQAQGLLLRVET